MVQFLRQPRGSIASRHAVKGGCSPAAAATRVTETPCPTGRGMVGTSKEKAAEGSKKGHGGGGMFAWQFSNADVQKAWRRYSFNMARWWGDFPRPLRAPQNMFATYPWAIGPFTKYAGNPVLAPTAGAWDQGRIGGGVHNGAVLFRRGRFYYIYRGERPWHKRPGYICDIGIATSRDGLHFTKDSRHSPLFHNGRYRRYSYEDVSVAEHDGMYYLFCNQWLWDRQGDPRVNGTFLAISPDLVNWKRVGIVFPQARRIHRNAVVLQDPRNRAVPVNGKFVMYLNNGLMAYSTDMRHWESHEVSNHWPGGEGCFALANHCPEDPERIVLFTGGPHTGHFYAIGQVLFSTRDPERPSEYLPRPVLTADPAIPHEHGFSAADPTKMISSFADCIFFNGLTQHTGRWWMYYGGSEYYTCLATASAVRKKVATHDPNNW